MTVAADYHIETYEGNGVTEEFAIPFKFFDEEIAVYKNKTYHTYTKGADYDVFNNGNGGKIVFKIAPLEGEFVTIVRSVPLNQMVKFIEGADFPAQDYEYSLDRIIMALQEMQADLKKVAIPPASMSLEDFFSQYLTKEQADKRYVWTTNYKAHKVEHQDITIGQVAPVEVSDKGDFKYAYANNRFTNYDNNICGVYKTVIVTFNVEDAMSGVFAPVADFTSEDDGEGGTWYSITIYAKEQIQPTQVHLTFI